MAKALTSGSRLAGSNSSLYGLVSIAGSVCTLVVSCRSQHTGRYSVFGAQALASGSRLAGSSSSLIVTRKKSGYIHSADKDMASGAQALASGSRLAGSNSSLIGL